MHPTITTSVASAHRDDMFRTTAAHRQVREARTAGPARTPRSRPAWWIRTTIRTA